MRIWFNHWFSTAYHLINLIRSNEPKRFELIGTNKNAYAVYRQVCDEWYIEPENISADGYIDFCIDFCRKHSIDVFVPRRFLTEIAKNAHRFYAVGVKLFANTNADIMTILDDKIQTYTFFTHNGFHCIPPVRVVESLDEFDAAYEELRSQADRICYKLIKDEGARSFRVIDDRVNTLSGLLERPGSKISLSSARKILGEYDFSIPVLLMPYLSGVEISADCLKTKQGNIIIPRFKTGGRYSEIRFEKSVMNECEKILRTVDLNMPANIQFRMHNDQLYLLEINPRMSGGLQLSCLASGINIPKMALYQLLGQGIEWRYPNFESRRVSYIETPICC